MAKRPKLKDVAERAGVSPTTASLVLNDKADGIPEETKQRVLEASEDLGYRPNVLAATLRKQTSDTIGFISDEIATTPYAGAMVQGAQDEAWQAGKLLLLVDTNRDEEIEARAIDSLLSRQVDGIVYAAMYHQVVAVPETAREVPVVLLDARSADQSVSSVVPDEFGAAMAATQVLVEAGHRRIAFIENEDPIPAAPERLAGYRAALEAAGIPSDPDLVVSGSPEDINDSDVVTGARDAVGGFRAASILLDRDPRPTAIFCFNDRMAGGVIRKAHQLGLVVPDDLSVVGFDDQELVLSQIDPPLTTMRLPHYEMGRWAVQHLLEEIAGGGRKVVHHRMPCPLIERQSVAPPSRGAADAAPSQ